MSRIYVSEQSASTNNIDRPAPILEDEATYNIYKKQQRNKVSSFRFTK